MFPKGDTYPILFEEVYKRIDLVGGGDIKKVNGQGLKDKSNGSIQNHF